MTSYSRARHAPDHHLLERESCAFREAIVRGSMERLIPILMTALVTGVGMIPLALGKGEPGKEIQQPLAVAILAGVFTSTSLKMIATPALYLKFANDEERVKKRKARCGCRLNTQVRHLQPLRSFEFHTISF